MKEKEQEIMSQLKARIQEIENGMKYAFEYDDDGYGLSCRVGPFHDLEYYFWIEDNQIKYSINLIDNFDNEYCVDNSDRSSDYELTQINEVADLIYNFAL